ncbi:MAG: hypothetical protein CSB44_12640 [Gammaproteobacteria bacterium]|nr:MAG: hypothetical protein CSB44_12640 [Gammaproteobacteria bacterium]PIE36455.1 MAG: hypothetical protein CSA54_04340 [Gammaproteobacteria bacterium]
MNEPRRKVTRIRRFLGSVGKPFWFALGAIALALGAIGAVLPVLPTTPFVILAAFAFARGSPRVARYLEQHRVFGAMIRDWRNHGAIAVRYKAIAMVMMAAALLLSIVMGLSGRVIVVQAVVISVAAAFILTRPSV